MTCTITVNTPGQRRILACLLVAAHQRETAAAIARQAITLKRMSATAVNAARCTETVRTLARQAQEAGVAEEAVEAITECAAVGRPVEVIIRGR